MLKSIAAVVGSYLLSVVLVVATDPLLSRLFPGDFVKGRIPSNSALIASTAFFVVISVPLCLALRPLRSKPRRAACALVLYRRGSHGHRCDYFQLEQGLAALVLVVLPAHLAGELLDWPVVFRAPGCSAVRRRSD